MHRWLNDHWERGQRITSSEAILCKQKTSTTPAESKQESVPHNVENSDQGCYSEEHECVSVCTWAYDTDTHTQSVLCLLCSSTCDELRARGWCMRLLMCNSSQYFVLFIEVTGPCGDCCFCEDCKFRFQVGSQHYIGIFFSLVSCRSSFIWFLSSDSDTLGKSCLGIYHYCSTELLHPPPLLPQQSDTLWNSKTVSLCIKGSLVGLQFSHNCGKDKRLSQVFTLPYFFFLNNSDMLCSEEIWEFQGQN